MFNISDDTETRLWNKYSQDTFELLNNLDTTTIQVISSNLSRR